MIKKKKRYKIIKTTHPKNKRKIHHKKKQIKETKRGKIKNEKIEIRIDPHNLFF